ncbi:MAG: lysylphosphatidylglycerol synthase transmembrane domain-containing protein [Candidatus Solibacter sp.]
MKPSGYDEGVTESRRRIPGWLPQVLGCSLSAGCLIWVLHGYPLNELGPTLRSLDYRWVGLALAADLAVYLAHGWRWTTLLIPVARVSFWRTVQAIYIGLFANEVLPLRTGEIIRCYLLAHWNDLRVSLAFASAGVERIIDGVWMLVAFLITASFVRGIPRDLTILVRGLAALLLLCVGALFWIVIHKHHAHAVLSEGRWSVTLRHIVEGLQLMGNPRTLGLTVAISLLYFALEVFFVFALMRAYGLDLSLWVAFGVLTILRLSTVVPNAPGNLGVVNFACVVALSLFEVEKTDAKTFSIIYSVASTMPHLIVGAIATALTGVNIGELRDRARQGARQRASSEAAKL